ncbi:MAG: EamA family transporter [Phycisphaerae bacterium]|nr:EamA family transporter [Phycisphaerae bacterium]
MLSTAYALLLQRFRASVLAGLPSAGVTLLTYGLTAALLLPIVTLSGGIGEIPGMNAVEWFCILYIGVVSTVVAYTIYNIVVDRIGAARTSQLTYAVPALTTLLSFFLLSSFAPTWRAAIGVGVVTVGLVIADGRAARFLTNAARRRRQ